VVNDSTASSEAASWESAAPEPAPVPARTPVAVLVGIAVAVAVLGVPFGLLWSVVAPDVPVLVTERGPAFADPQPEQLAAADGWFAILAIPFGVLVAAGVWLATRRGRGVPALVGLAAGMTGAGLLAWWLGRRIGLSGYRDTLAAAEVGTDLARPADLAVAEVGWWPPHVLGVVLVPALAAVTTYTLLAAWSPYPDLHIPAHALDLTGAEPDRPAGP
jgi:hypothetical protein